jgi:RNA polymerase sigma-70 factor, ECF subfamily
VASAAVLTDFPALLDIHRGIVRKVAASYSRSRDDRDDLTQEIATALWQAWPSYDPARPFSTWMYRVALNVAISHRKRERYRWNEVPDEEAAEIVGAQDVDIDARQQLEALQRAMRQLSPVNRALLLLHLDGCSQRDCAEVLGTTEGNVATRLGRIKDQLRRFTGNA